MGEIIGKIIEGKSFGIPAEIFLQSNFEQVITGESGYGLYCNISPRSIWIIDSTDETTALYGISGFHAEVTNQVLKMGIYTKGFNGIPEAYHPDLFASELVTAAFAYFERVGTNIKFVNCHWDGPKDKKLPSDTYRQFIDSLNGCKDPLSAIKAVWSVRQIAKFGYTEIVPGSFLWCRTPDHEMVDVYFQKPFC